MPDVETVVILRLWTLNDDDEKWAYEIKRRKMSFDCPLAGRFIFLAKRRMHEQSDYCARCPQKKNHRKNGISHGRIFDAIINIIFLSTVCQALSRILNRSISNWELVRSGLSCQRTSSFFFHCLPNSLVRMFLCFNRVAKTFKRLKNIVKIIQVKDKVFNYPLNALAVFFLVGT